MLPPRWISWRTRGGSVRFASPHCFVANLGYCRGALAWFRRLNTNGATQSTARSWHCGLSSNGTVRPQDPERADLSWRGRLDLSLRSLNFQQRTTGLVSTVEPFSTNTSTLGVFWNPLPGTRHLELVTWNPLFGTQHLELVIWNSPSGTRHLEPVDTGRPLSSLILAGQLQEPS